ncbi:hypothetical protein [Bradyrhizobium acaciae]|uniref:hypothetical protein n=1 Tax=Bradyrhizobium acaciae TaxID=2683706 RepID=UPI001E319CEC|nr:hypothetical protein [Bradyrhizobium acaciae]MCC8978538.1 hypothetical protein [Bradyrhizobium acaciae]
MSSSGEFLLGISQSGATLEQLDALAPDRCALDVSGEWQARLELGAEILRFETGVVSTVKADVLAAAKPGFAARMPRAPCPAGRAQRCQFYRRSGWSRSWFEAKYDPRPIENVLWPTIVRFVPYCALAQQLDG